MAKEKPVFLIILSKVYKSSLKFFTLILVQPISILIYINDLKQKVNQPKDLI